MTTRWSSYVGQRLSELWRGEGDYTGLQRPSREAVDKASQLAVAIFRPTTPTPSVVPGEDGEVVFFWHKKGWVLQLAVGESETTVWCHHPVSGAMWSGPLEDVRSKVDEMLRELED